MKNLYYVTNGYCYDFDAGSFCVRVVLAENEDEAEHLAMVSFKEEHDLVEDHDPDDDMYYTGLKVHFIREFQQESQVVWDENFKGLI